MSWLPRPLLALYRASRTDLGRGVLLIVTAALVSLVFAHHSVLHDVERWTFDVLARIDPPPPRGVVVVDIDDAAYEALFDGTSPLAPAALSKLIGAVARGRPAAIGIDIDTASRRFAGFVPDPAWPPTVWAQAIRPAEPDDDVNRVLRSGDFNVLVSGALGGGTPAAPARAAIPVVLADDGDRRVRRYQQRIRVGDAEATSLARALAEQSGRPLANADARPRIIRYAPVESRLRIRALDALELAASDGWQGPAGPLHGKLVLLGGSWSGLDRHATPLGEMKGIDILANVVETELEGGGPTQPGWFRVFVIQIFGAVFVSLLLYLVPSRVLAGLVFVAALVVLAPLSSALAYGSLDRWLYFALVYLAAAATHVLDDVKADLSQRQTTAVRGAFDTLKGHWQRRRTRGGALGGGQR